MANLQKSKASSEPLKTSKMERFAKIFNGFQPFTNFAKSSILDVWQAFEYTSEIFSKAVTQIYL